jgi:ubiquitin-protein ligase
MWGWLTSTPEPEQQWDPLAPATPVLQHRTAVAPAPATVVSPWRPSPFHTPQLLSPRAALSPPSAFQTPARAARDEQLMSESEFEAFSLLADYRLLPRRLPPGVYVLPSLGEPLTWCATVCPQEGPFAGGIFEFSLHFKRYPLQCPALVSGTRLFHPLVHPVSGAVASLVPQWSARTHRVWHVLAALHSALLRPVPAGESALNADAESQLRDSPAVFAQFAAQCAKESALKARAALEP